MNADHAGMLSNIRAMRRGVASFIVESAPNSPAEYVGAEGDRLLKNSLDEAVLGLDDHSSIVLPAGRKAIPAPQSQRDMEFEKQRRLSREIIGGTIGVMPGTVGVLEYANYANMEAQLRFLYNLEVFPLCDLLQGVVQRGILNRYKTGVTGYFKKEGVRALFEDMDKLSQIAERLQRQGVPFAQINERLEMGFDADKIPSASESFLPFGLVPYGDSSGANGSVVESVKGRRSIQRRQDLSQKERQRSVIWHALIDRVSDVEAGAFRGVRGFLKGLVVEMTRNLKAASPAGQGLSIRKHDIADDFLFDFDDATQNLRAVLRPAWEKAARRGGGQIIAQLGLDLDFSLLDPAVRIYVGNKNLKIKNITATLAEEAREIIKRGIDDGWTIDRMAERLAEKFESPYRSRVIARTETIDAFSDGRHSAMILADVEKKEWLTARDDNVRESHIAADGQIVPLGEPFTLGSGAQMMRPLDDSLGADAGDIVQCRCVELAVVDEGDGGL
jgi:hypothetical protein